MSFDIKLGTTQSGNPFTWRERDRSTHMQVVGASGRGKSKFIESMLRQDIASDDTPGVFLLDPHGSLYDAIVAWIASQGYENTRTIHLVNPSDVSYAFGYNPLRDDPGTHPSVRVDAMVQACAQVWGGEDPSRTPLLKKCLRSVFFALLDKGYTLLEAVDLVSATDSNNIRQYMTTNLSDHVFESIWEDFNGLADGKGGGNKRIFVEQFSSTNNRLLEFLSSPTIRNVVGQSEDVIDFRECMETGDVVLVNLAPSSTLSNDNARLLGTLMLNDILITALGRDAKTAQERPFYVYIDECYQYLTQDIEKMLDQTRKFGVHLILGHQRLGQIKEAGDSIYNAVMTGAQTKVVFGGLTSEDAHEMAADIFLGEFDLNQGVEMSKRAVATGEFDIELLRGGSDTEGEAQGTSEMTSDSWGEGVGSGSVAIDSSDGLVNVLDSLSSMSGGGHAQGSSWARNNSRTAGWSETLKQKYIDVYNERKGYQELLYEGAVHLNNQRRQQAYVKVPNLKSRTIQIETIDEPMITPEYVEKLHAALLEKGKYTTEIGVLHERIAERTTKLKALAYRDEFAEEPESEYAPEPEFEKEPEPDSEYATDD